ncbi:MAG: hypothetical protein JWN39_3736 [Ilumatobacteraceae bacterium]|nr:hypothetical protein [Ilumatobacteraceae bacterium]
MGAGCIATAGLLADSHLVQSICFAVVALAMIPVALLAHRRNDLPMLHVRGLIGLTLCNALADLMRTATEGHPAAMVWAETIGLMGVLMLITAVSMVARNRRGRDFWAILADGGIVAFGVWLMAWVTIVGPTIDRANQGTTITVLRSAFPPLGAVIMFLLVIIVFSDRARTPAIDYSCVAILLAIVGGFLRGLHASGTLANSSPIPTALSTLATGLVFSAVLHPSVRTLVAPMPDAPQRQFVGRVAATAAALVVPVMVMSAVTPIDRIDRIIRTVSVGILAMLVAGRTIQAVRGNRSAQDALLHSARTDSLTGLPNRAVLLETLNTALHEAWRADDAPTLFFIDLDRFKNINDSLGHAAGDRVLCILADRLRHAVPERATVARMAGDEFVVLDPASPSMNASLDLAHDLLAELREPIGLPAPAGDVFVTTSIGMTRSSAGSDITAQVLLGQADTAMYQAKDAGRNCIALFDESMRERVAHRLALETALFRALERDELRLHYQPNLELSTGAVSGFEALMRWQLADGTIVSPAEFIPISEESGTINKMGAWALLEAMTQLHDWIADGVCSPTANMSVNVSPRQLADPAFPTVVSEALLRSQLAPDLLWLEVTEGIMISEPEIAMATLRRLRSLGVRVAIDDFGTGYSSLSSLQQFPLQRIKIDRAFVQGVADNVNDRSLVRTIIAMGASLGLDMVAEGVETVEQMRVLDELGCMKAQGYLISRPIPPDAMRATVAAVECKGSMFDPHVTAPAMLSKPLLVGVDQRSSASALTSSKGSRSSV